MATNYPQVGRITVRIDEVDLENRIVYAVDSKNQKMSISFNYQDTVFTIPKPGDIWMISRDQYQWYFESRLEKIETDKILITDLKIGDTRLRAVGDLHIETTGVLLNERPLGVTTWDKWTVSLGVGDSQKVLTHHPLDIGSIQLFNNGSLVDPTTISIDDVNPNKIYFGPSLASGVAVIYYQYTPVVIRVEDLLA
jgi:hypothetical protein